MLSVKRRWLSWCAAVAALVFVPFFMGADNHAKPKYGEYNPDNTTVEMFKAIEEGQIAVKLIPKDSRQSNVMIENKTAKPLNVKLPEAFAGVPILAQGRQPGSTSSSRNSGGGNQNQSMGGGMGGMGGGGMGGGMFNVPPEKTAKFKVPTVCLEHGKNEPREAIPYEIKPIDAVAPKAGVAELCEMIGSGKLDQRSAQAAAWHLNNGMSWQELSAKQLKFANGSSKPYFSAQEIQTGMELASSAKRTAEEREKNKEKQEPTPKGNGSLASPSTT